MFCLSRQRYKDGFSLLELLVVVSLLGILFALGVSRYAVVGDKMKSLDAEHKQMEIMQRQHAYFARHQTYTLDLAKLGFATNDGTIASDKAHFNISAVRCEKETLTQCVQLRARPATPPFEDVLIFDSRGRKQ